MPLSVDVDFAALALDIEVMRKLALEALGAAVVPEELAHNRFRIHTCHVVQKIQFSLCQTYAVSLCLMISELFACPLCAHFVQCWQYTGG